MRKVTGDCPGPACARVLPQSARRDPRWRLLLLGQQPSTSGISARYRCGPCATCAMWHRSLAHVPASCHPCAAGAVGRGVGGGSLALHMERMAHSLVPVHLGRRVPHHCCSPCPCALRRASSHTVHVARKGDALEFRRLHPAAQPVVLLGTCGYRGPGRYDANARHLAGVIIGMIDPLSAALLHQPTCARKTSLRGSYATRNGDSQAIQLLDAEHVLFRGKKGGGPPIRPGTAEAE